MCGIHFCAYVAGDNAIEGIFCPIVQVQFVGLRSISHYHIQVAVSIHIAQCDCISRSRIRAYFYTAGTIERISGSIVQVQFVDRTISPCHHIQVAVSIYIAQRYCISRIRIRTYVQTADSSERVSSPIVKVHLIGLIITNITIPCHHIQVAVSIHIAQGDSKSMFRIHANVQTADAIERIWCSVV